jgi:hypothetical protein
VIYALPRACSVRGALSHRATRSDLLTAALPQAAERSFCDGALSKRTVVQLYRLGVAAPQPSLLVPFVLSHYALHADVADSNTVARFVLPLGDLALPRKFPKLEAHTEKLRDGGAAAVNFLAKLGRGDADPTELVLRTWLRRADGASAVLHNELNVDDLADVRVAALTWNSSSATDTR